MTLAEFDRRWAALLAVWRALHRATDTPESAGAVRALAAALRTLGAYAVTCGEAPAGDRAAVLHAAHVLLARLREAGALREEQVADLRALGPRAEELAAMRVYSADEDAASVRLVSRCLPALWDVVRHLQDELRALRPAAFHLRRARRIGLLLAAALGLGLAAAGAREAFERWGPRGWRVTYYDGMNFETLVTRRGEAILYRDYGKQRPAAWVDRSRWSARWEGILRIPATGAYTFQLQADDGYRLYVDGALVLERWREQSWRTSSAKVTLELPEGDHAVRVEHYDHTGEAAIRLRWSGGPIARATVLGTPHVRKP